jgi:YVTN family beta-propeller protein
MRHNRGWFWDSRIQNRDNGLSSLRSFRWLLLLLTAGLASVPAAAQCDVYMAAYKTNHVEVINTRTKTVVAEIPVQVQPLGVAITPNGAFAYVTNSGKICDLCAAIQSPSVSVIDTATYSVVATIPVGNYPVGVAITPNGAFAYVATSCDSQASVIDTATNAVVATVGSLNDPRSMAITPDGAFAYVGNEGSGSLSVIATATNTMVDTVQVALFPEGIAIRPYSNAVGCR